MEENKQHQIITFGKYKGQPVEVLQSDPSYCRWLKSQDWFAQRFPTINTLIINNFAVPEDTPEHNALQVRFLENDIVNNLIRRIYNLDKVFDSVMKKSLLCCEKCKREYEEEKNKVKEYNEEVDRKYKGLDLGDLLSIQFFYKTEPESLDCANCTELCKVVQDHGGSELIIEGAAFEINGWDVRIDARFKYADEHFEDYLFSILVEIKPDLGDNFPSVLRQMKSCGLNSYRHSIVVLLYKNFTATNVTIRQVKDVFAKSGFKVISFDDIEISCQGRIE